MIEKHDNPMDVFFFVLEGEGIFLGGETGISRKKGQGIHMEGGLPRSIENTGIAELRVLVLKDK